MSLKHTFRGDTMVEVLFSIAVFGLVAVISITVMNSGVYTAEATLELSMARNEIDAQSEAVRFIHNSFLSEREFANENQEYRNLWLRLKKYTNEADSNAVQPLSVESCSTRYSNQASKSIFGRRTVIFNTRKIDPKNPASTIYSASENSSVFRESSLYPRLIFHSGASDSDATLRETYTALEAAEGIWVIPIKSSSTVKAFDNTNQPEFYDFHVYTCWAAPGRSRATTIGTIIRLYNPELVERENV